MTVEPLREGDSAPAHRARLGDRLLLDELTEQLGRTRSLLTSSPEAAAERALDRMGGQSEVEARIAAELAVTEPLAQPGRFPEAHRLAMHALEVLDRYGSRGVQVKRLWFLSPVAEQLIEMVADYIVQSFAEGVVGRLRSLYARREAQCPPEAPERRLLARARVETDRLAPGFNGGGSLATIILVGTIAVPALAGLTNYVGAIDFTDRSILGGSTAVVFLLFLAISAVVMRGAAAGAAALHADHAAAAGARSGRRSATPATRRRTTRCYSRRWRSCLAAAVWLLVPLVPVALIYLTD